MATLADLLTSKIPPHSLEAERAVLGALLREPGAWPQILELLGPFDFYKEGHRKIFAAMTHLHAAGRGVDLLTVDEALKQADELEEVGGPATLALLFEEAGILPRLPDYAAIVRAKAELRNVIRLSTELIGRAYEHQAPLELLTHATSEFELLTRRAAPASEAFPALHGAEFLKLDIPAPTFRVGGWIPSIGLTFIVGDSEACKSWFMLVLAVSIAAGLPLLGTFPVTQAPTLVISEENGQAEDQRRLHLIFRGLDLDPDQVPIHMASDTSFNFDEPAKYAALRAYIDRHGIRMVLVDSFLRVHRREEGDAVQMSSLYMDRMKPLFRDGLALILLHHRRKLQRGPGPAPVGDNDEIRGSGDLRAAADAVLFLRTVSDTQVLVKHNKSRGAKRQEPYVFAIADTDQGAVTLTFEGTPEQALDKSGGCREAILLYAAEKGSFARRNLQDELKGRFSRKVFDPVLKALSDKGTPLRLELRGPRHMAWYVYVPQGPDTPVQQELGDDDVPF
jgi:hypothetical protein